MKNPSSNTGFLFSPIALKFSRLLDSCEPALGLMFAGKTKESKAAPKKKQRKKEREGEMDKRAGLNWNIVVLVLLLVLMLVQMIFLARSKSATMDEQNHITRGAVYTRTGDLRLARSHPPLINLLSALPLLPDSSLTLPLDDPSWQEGRLDMFARKFLWETNHNSHSIVVRARLPIIALTLLFGAIVYLWARELYGERAGLLALGLVAADPNILAHGSLVTTDMGVTCFATLSAYTFWRWMKQPAWTRAVIAGISLGLAQASKFSAAFLILALVITAMVYWFSTSKENRRPHKFLHLAGWLVLMGVIAAITLWAVYGFKLGLMPNRDVTVPASVYFDELQKVSNRVAKGNSSFLMGSYSDKGWWYYFPVAFAVKTPLPTLILFGIAMFYTWQRRVWQKALPLLIPVVIYFGISIASPLNIGYRHLLPALAFLFIFAGQLGEIRWRPRSVSVWIGVLLLAWLAIGSGLRFPHYLAYFNEIAGGPGGGYRVLVDSNLDWGQDLIELKKYMDREGIQSVNLSYFGTAFPENYGLTYEPLPGYPRNIWPHDHTPIQLLSPAPGIYAISATNLQGALFENHDLYAWFRVRKPDAVIGYSIFIYKHKVQ